MMTLKNDICTQLLAKSERVWEQKQNKRSSTRGGKINLIEFIFFENFQKNFNIFLHFQN
jgi:hypothetical protein